MNRLLASRSRMSRLGQMDKVKQFLPSACLTPYRYGIPNPNTNMKLRPNANSIPLRAFSSTPSTSTSSSTKPLSYIDMCKAHGSQSVIGRFPTAGYFDKCLSEMIVEKMDISGICECRMPVTDTVRNAYGTLHGGAIATLIDIVGTLALLARDHTRGGVSVDLNCNYVSAVKVGEEIKIVGRVLKCGASLGFTQVDILKADGTIIATGRHTKFM